MPETLVILSPGFPKDETDSTCIPAQQTFVKALKESRPDLHIIVLTFHYPFYRGRYLWHGVEVIAAGGKGNGKLLRLLTWRRVWKVLEELNREYRLIGLLSFWFGECALIGERFSMRHTLKHYCWILGQDAKAGNSYFKRIRPKSEGLIALSDFIVREFKTNYSIRPGNLIPVGVDVSLFGPLSQDTTIDILGAGSLISLKQYDVFITLVSLLKKEFPGIKAVICGGGPEMNRLQQKIKSLQLESNISLEGELPHTIVLALMQRTKVFLHPSAYEGFGLVCLEALYAGAKVLSFVRPMDEAIANWHIAVDQEDMLRQLRAILQLSHLPRERVFPYAIHDNARTMLGLFNYKEPAIS
jgi:glycosyltransferase involved in cell wall biosynthesis